MELRVERDYAAVERDCAALLAAAGQENLFLAPWWWRSMLAAGLPSGGEARFLIGTSNNTPVAMLPVLATEHGRRLEGLAGPYTCLFQPLFAPSSGATTWHAAGAAIARHCRAGPPLRLDALDPAALWLAPFLAGAAQGGLHAARFEHFGNWHEPVAGIGWDAYLRARPGGLRETVRRKMKRATGIGFAIVTGGPALEPAIATYENVYASSWKIPEPFPDFNAELMRQAAAAGTLRLGLLHSGAQAIAAQLWILANGGASVLKLAHDEAFKPLSPGTLLAAHMIRHFLDEEHVEKLDFGRGDDPYKQLWTTARRPRIGVILANPWQPRGAAVLARHALGRLRRRLA